MALAEFESNLPGDINAYKACYGVHTTVNYIDADSPGPAPGPGSGEAALDIENIIGLAPRATHRCLPGGLDARDLRHL